MTRTIRAAQPTAAALACAGFLACALGGEGHVSAAPPTDLDAISALSAATTGPGLSVGEYKPAHRTDKVVLVIGDSLSIPLGERMESHLRERASSVRLARFGKVSSGLARPEFFDWNARLGQLMATVEPSVVVVMMGTNDNKALPLADGSMAAFGTDAWASEYAGRVRRLLRLAAPSGEKRSVLWVGAPVMAKQALNSDLQTVNEVIEHACRSYGNCHYVDTRHTLSRDGKYSPFTHDSAGQRVRIRAADGVHLTAPGAEMLLHALPREAWTRGLPRR